MIILGCFLALGIVVAPRVMLILAWIFSSRWPIVWGGDLIMPLLGIAFLPYTTIMYMLVWKPTGIDGWDWLWILMGLILDLIHWGHVVVNREKVPGYDTATSQIGVSSSSRATSAAVASTAAAPPAAAPGVAPSTAAASSGAGPESQSPPTASVGG